MLFAHRMRLMAFGLVGLASAIFTAADPHTPTLVAVVSPVQGGIGGLLIATAMLPGRMARFF